MGAFYTVAKLPVDDSDKFCAWCLSDFEYEGQTVFMAPASGFYTTPGSGTNEVRIAYVLMKEELNRSGVTKVNGILLDLGVSSFQLDTPERGFTYREVDAPLDMRMDQRQTLTAKDIVNDYSESELFRIIRDYGEDRFAKNIA